MATKKMDVDVIVPAEALHGERPREPGEGYGRPTPKKNQWLIFISDRLPPLSRVELTLKEEYSRY